MYDAALRPVKLKITQFSELRNVHRLQPVSISALAKEMALDRSTLGRNLLVLKRRGLVALSEGDDLRERSVELTAKGATTLEKALPCWQRAQQKVERTLGADGAAKLFELLGQVEALR
ncbi:MAG TPA: MarR family winged helix-turn-helix transcriptional regulator [Burkholderiales bacterium]|nr:MarR family winged helix-turn-helix transcriptional regulator [Burkholderiales bacterium]